MKTPRYRSGFNVNGDRKQLLDDLHKKVIEKASDGIVVLKDEKIVLSNHAFVAMLDYEGSELEGTKFEDLVEPSRIHEYRDRWESIVHQEDSTGTIRARLLTKRKRILNVEMSTAALDFEGEPALVTVVRDVSERTTLEAAVEKSEARYRTLYESSPIAYFTLSPRGTVQQVNNAAEKLLGYSQENMTRRNISAFLPKDEKAREMGNQVIAEMLQGKNLEDIEMQFQHAKGTKIWVSITSSVLSDSIQSSSIGLMALEIDRRKAAESREAEERERANLYLEVMTHDLNNINQSALFTMELLTTTVDLPENLESVLTETSWNVRRSARMIANMRAIITLKQSPPARSKTDLHPHLQRALSAADRDFPWKTLNVNSNITDDAFEVAGHMYLWSVFFNIIHNSMMFTEGNEINVNVHAELIDSGKMIRIAFVDYGPGIRDDMKQYIFKRTGSPDAQIVGRGLGLTVVDHYITDLGGTVWVEDRVEGDHSQGTRIVMLLPAWIEKKELPCGRATCITFYKSDHCLFCEPTYDILMMVLDEMSIPHHHVEVINVDDPSAGISEGELPMLPFVKICDVELTGLVSDDQVRSAVMMLLMKDCYPVP
ncbi:MAG: PAS domain S-box protein [Candidatus Thorarchaeota archaeon]